ncbi:Ig-like domain repeat protein [Nocardia sp. BMG111209]|uniref:Ig-like domain repeat protein n=1 Tax=Nocardia sp. BMG111209 TaxID=1160137 RepID=UPI00036B4AE2|nr:Ig-like domain repeat protein [Nocardia sp. BMG111209]
MRVFEMSRNTAGVVLTAAALAAPLGSASAAHAAVTPILQVAMTGSVLGVANTASVGCRQVAHATLHNPDGSPVSGGSVDFFSHLNGQAGNVVGTVPVSNGAAEISWVPDAPGTHVISAMYHDGGPDYQPVAGSITINAVNLGGACL